MSLSEMVEDGFPHGTVDGYRKGCRGGICAAELSCSDFTTRYNGDYGFRKAILAGEDVATILAREKAAQAAPRAQQTPTPGDARRAEIRRLNKLGWTDRRIAAHLGMKRSVVGDYRRAMGLPLNPDVKPPKPAPENKIDKRRDPHKETKRAEIARLNKERLSDQDIAARMGLSRHAVAEARREMGLPLNPAPKGPKRTDPSIRLKHGTFAMYTEGRCRKSSPCPANPPCWQVAADRRREWKNQKEAAA